MEAGVEVKGPSWVLEDVAKDSAAPNLRDMLGVLVAPGTVR